MKKYIVATQSQRKELESAHSKLFEGAEWMPEDSTAPLEPGDWVLDLMCEEYPAKVIEYLQVKDATVILGNLLEPLASVAEMSLEQPTCHLYGLNHLPGFLALPGWEMTKLKEDSPSPDGVPPMKFVADQVGLVTPRILAMIINEAYFMLQEGTADREAIDTAMKLGVNYPKGPLSWADEIGPDYIAALLSSLHAETCQEKYAPCRLLKQTIYQSS